MKKHLLWILPACAALLLIPVARTLGLEGGLSLICLPFFLCARGLRWLSLSGSLGNLLAIGLFVLLGLCPLLPGLGKKRSPEDWLLVLASIALWIGEYYLINPALLPVSLRGPVGQLVLCGAVYELLLCWAVLRLLKASRNMEKADYLRWLKTFLWLCAGVCVLSVIVTLASLPDSFRQLRETNTAPGLELTPTYVFLILSAAVTALEYLLDAWVLLLGAGLLRVLEQGPYTRTALAAADRVSLWCRRSLAVILLSHTAVNLSQALLASRLHRLSFEFRLPLLSLATVFALLALSGLLKKGLRLQEDNDLFI